MTMYRLLLIAILSLFWQCGSKRALPSEIPPYEFSYDSTVRLTDSAPSKEDPPVLIHQARVDGDSLYLKIEVQEIAGHIRFVLQTKPGYLKSNPPKKQLFPALTLFGRGKHTLTEDVVIDLTSLRHKRAKTVTLKLEGFSETIKYNY